MREGARALTTAHGVLTPAFDSSDEGDTIRATLVALVGERGFCRTTVEAVCERAGVGRAAFDAHYSDLDDCFCAVYEGWRDEFALAVGEGFVGGGERWRDRIFGAARAMLAWLQEDPGRARFMSVEVLSASSRAQLLRDQAMEGFYTLIDLGREEPSAPPSLTRATAESVGGAIYNRIHYR